MTDTLERPATETGRPTRSAPPLVDAWSLATVALGSLQPLANFLNANSRRLVWMMPVVWDAVLWVLLMVAAFVAVRFLTRRRAPFPIAAAFAVFNLSFWNFWRWLPIEPESDAARWIAIVVWAVVTAALVRLAMILAGFRYTKVFAVVFLGVWCASLLLNAASTRAAVLESESPALAPALDVTFTEKPNVYWFLLDEHARSDQLLEHTGSDNSWFGADLGERGFSVSESTTSAYLQTHLSVTSTLAMDYIWQPGHHFSGDYNLAAPIVNGANPTVATFEANGYRYVGAPDGRIEWATCPDEGPDRSCIDPVQGPLSMREPHSYLVWSTPIGTFDLPTTHNDLASVRDGIDGLLDDDQPFFLYAHLLQPHFPYRYDVGCGERPAWVSGTNLDRDQLAAAYANEVQCLDHDVVATVDHILAEDPDAVIVVQSDHGSAIDFTFGTSFDQVTDDQLDERFGAVNAIRLPGGCRGESIEGESLVNTFRLVLACLGGQEPDLLPTRHFFTEFADVSSIQEVPDDRLQGG